MSVTAVSTIFAVLLIGGLSGVGAVLAFDVGGIRADLTRSALPLAWIVAVGATAGSLWYSEVQNFEPCEFCWYQRIAMYPLAIILARVPWQAGSAAARYVLPVVIIGGAISVYHYQLQLFPEQSTSCSATTPCTGKWIEIWGFITIPMLALGAFTLIGLLLWTAGRQSART